MTLFVRGAALSAAVWMGGVAPTSGQPPAAERGREAFDTSCTLCHGSEGEGDAGPPLVPLKFEYRDILGIVRDGYGAMPPMSSAVVSDEQVADIVAYLEALTAQASSSPAPDPRRSSAGCSDWSAPAVDAARPGVRATTEATLAALRFSIDRQLVDAQSQTPVIGAP